MYVFLLQQLWLILGRIQQNLEAESFSVHL